MKEKRWRVFAISAALRSCEALLLYACDMMSLFVLVPVLGHLPFAT